MLDAHVFRLRDATGANKPGDIRFFAATVRQQKRSTPWAYARHLNRFLPPVKL